MSRCNKCKSALNGSHNRDDEKHYKILFKCDRRKCDVCDENACQHTTDIRHAKNFELHGDVFVEK